MKILYLDIETSPNLADVWGLWGQDIPLCRLRETGHIMGFGYMWNDEKRAKWVGEDTHEYDAMLEVANELYDEADIIVTYNGDKFDHKWLNAEWVVHGFTPPSPYKSIDLYQVVKKNFKFPSNKLEYVANRLLGDSKIKHSGYQMWKDCLDPDVDPRTKKKAWKEMGKYCKKDVELMPPLHDKLKPWLPTSLNVAIFDNATHLACEKCASYNLQKRGTAKAKYYVYQRYQCQDCGGWMKGRKSIYSQGKTLKG